MVTVPMAKRTDFFISYTKADRGWAEWIAWTLEDAGYTTSIQAWDFVPGTNFVVKMNDAIDKSKQIVIVLSKAYVRSGFANSEWAAGFADDPVGAKRRLLPVRVGDAPSHPLLKPLVHAVLAGASEAEARQRLLDAVKPRVKPTQAPAFPGKKTTAPASGPAGRPSFPGDPAVGPAAKRSGTRGKKDDANEAAVEAFGAIANRPAAEMPAGHFAEAMPLLMSGKLVPFLGLGVHFEIKDNSWGKKWSSDSPFFPSPGEYGNYLAQYLGKSERVESGSELARVYQFLIETRGRVFVQNAVHRLYNRDYPSKISHTFFASLNAMMRLTAKGTRLPLIVTTNLDDVLERTFRKMNEPFAIVSYISAGSDSGRLLFRSVDGQSQVLKNAGQVKRAAQADATIILKLHGGVDRDDPEHESMVLTEDEILTYFGSPAVTDLIPELLGARVGNGRFLFLGYSLRDWNIRFLLSKFWESRRQEMSWAVLFKTSQLTKTLWGKRGVEILDVAIEEYLAGLAREIGVTAPRRSD
jgi:hypothetical protein